MSCNLKFLPLWVCIAVLTGTSAAHAQTALEPLNSKDLSSIEQENGLLEINPFDRLYEPIEAGSFLLYPLLELQGSYNDNVFANDARKESDFITNIKPRMVLQKHQGRHSFTVDASADIQRAIDEKSEDIEDYEIALKAELEARHSLSIPLSFKYETGHTDRAKIRTSDISTAPLEYQKTEASGGIAYTPGRLSLKLLGRAASLRLDNGTNWLDGATITRENADRNVYDLSFTGAYKFHPYWEPFIQSVYQRENFKRTNTAGNTQDKTLWQFLSGLNFDYKGLITGHIGAGLDHRAYEESGIDSSNNLALDASITANISRRTSIGAELTRFSVTDNDITTGLVSTTADLKLKHELSPDLFLIGTSGYTLDDFESSSREDDYYHGGLSLQYISSPALRLALEYDYASRESTTNGIDFERNLFILRLLGAL